MNIPCSWFTKNHCGGRPYYICSEKETCCCLCKVECSVGKCTYYENVMDTIKKLEYTTSNNS